MPNLPFRPPPVAADRPRPRPVQPPTARPAPRRELARELRRAPWFAISAIAHLSLLVVLAAMVVRYPAAPEPEGVTFQVNLSAAKPAPVEAPEPPKPEEPKPEETVPEEPPPEVEPAPPAEETRPLPPAPPTPAPEVQQETATVEAAPVLEVPGRERPSRDVFASRGPVARREALREWGGSPASEKAVDLGLEWLHRHQDPGTGRWADGDPQLKLAPALTGLALLAFLGKGHTHAAPGPYRDTVARGIGYLLGIQTSVGRFGEAYLAEGEPSNRYLMYHQGIATMALAEAYAMTQDPALRDAASRAVGFIERAQQDGGGWDYGDLRTGRCDTSITGWQMMALKSAHAAGIEVKWQTLFGVMRHLDLYTNSLGEVGYANKDPGTWRRGSGMLAVGMCCYQMLGWPRDSALLVRQADALLRDLPDWDKMNRADRGDLASYLHTMYYWYYGTLGLFNTGGHWWQRWNLRLRELLIATQVRDGERRGSWPPPSRGFDAAGGRTYTTAINVLNLEIYYRYLPFYRAEGFDAVAVLEQAANVRGVSTTRHRALRLLAGFRTPRAQDLLVEALRDPSPAARAIACRALVDQRCDRVVPTLIEELGAPNPFARAQAIGQLATFEDRRCVPHLIKALGDSEKVVRERAAIALRKLTGENFAFRPEADAAERDRTIAQWEEWWRGENAQLPPEGVHGTVLVVDPEAPDAVVLDVGRDHAVRRGVRFEIRRDGKTIAVVEAERAEPTLTVAKIIERRGEPPREGDAVQSIPEAAVTHLDKD